MNSRIVRTVLVSLFALGFGGSMAAPAHAAGPCSIARAAGNWAYTTNGTLVGIGPRISVGTFTLDAAGNVLNGVVTASLNGAIDSETFSGTYTVNPDCTGTISVNVIVSDGSLLALTLNIAFDNNVQHMRGIFVSIVAPDGTSFASVIALDANKQ